MPETRPLPPAKWWNHFGQEAAILGTSLLAIVAVGAGPECRALLDGMQAKVESNYAGFQLEVRDTRRTQYQQALARARRDAATVTDDGCLDVLKRYIGWFADPHLFVYQSPRLDSTETLSRMATVPTRQVDRSALHSRLSDPAARLDPIEGIWYDRGMHLAVIPAPDGTRDRFIAVVVASDTVTLPVGAVHATFIRRTDGSYDAELRWRSLAVTRPLVTLHRGGTLMRLSPGMWGKVVGGPAAERALLDTADAHRPTLAWRGDTVAVIAIPSHDYSQRASLGAILAGNRDRLDSAKVLVIDLRGNEGGSSLTTAALNPYLMGDGPLAPEPDHGAPMMLSSADQVSYARRSFGNDSSTFVRRIVAAMAAAPGELVPLFDPAQPVPAPEYPPPRFGPRRVLVLIDGGTVSAAEVLVQLAIRSDRAVVVGEPTAGALDYQSVSIVRIHPDENRWFLGYPTIAAHSQLPEGGMRGKGIAPEVELRWAGVSDPVAAAVRAASRVD